MSNISRFLILFLVLCTSYFHMCNARNLLGAISKENKEEMSPLQIKNEMIDNKVSVAKQSVTTTKLNPNMKEPIEDNKGKQIRVHKDDQNLKSSKSQELKGKGAKHSNSKHGDDGSLVSISWKVPHDKIGEKQPGFNLDYSPPREHPGHHN